ncbi:LysR family transcriptional regulator [Paraburkholderia sp. MM5482-R1]|uniref:LysR family transcriptional regulator n=1 Tax=unclassified Paraburkholderia TaxID=2615204 RepID=UPI003D1BCF08
MENLDLLLLRVFVNVYEERSVRAAAIELHMSQPGLSTALARLRKILADPLFIKTARAMEPTQRARDLYEPIKAIVTSVENDVLATRKFDPLVTNREFRIALSDVGEAIYMPLAIQALSLASPHATLRTVSVSPDEMQEAMGSGAIDLAAGYFPDIRANSFLHRRINDHSFACVMRHDHPLLRGVLSLERFLEARHVVVEAAGRSQEVLESFFAQQHLNRPVGLRTPHFMSLPMIISATDLIATVPQALADFMTGRHHGIGQARLPFTPPTFQSNLYWSRAMNLDPANSWLREVLFPAFQNVRAKHYERNGRGGVEKKRSGSKK